MEQAAHLPRPAARALASLAAAALLTGAHAAPPAFATGADLSWTTELEARGYTWRDAAGVETECFALMKSLGVNAVRLRVWVDPKDGWNAGADLSDKARRAARLKLPLMIDFHYSDTWADPGAQTKPARWASLDRTALARAVGAHTADVLKAVQATGAEIAWVQIGNEIRPGLLWDVHADRSGALHDISRDGQARAAGNPANFARILNAAAAAVRRTCPRARVIVHCDHGDRWGDLVGVLEAARTVKYDMFGVSLYPPPDWGPSVRSCADNLARINREYGKATMVCEFGMPTYPFDPARDATAALLAALKKTKGCRGLFYWEPESAPEMTGYKMGASTARGKVATPSPALAPFKPAPR